MASRDADRTGTLADRVRAAAASGTPLAIRGGGSKAFLGREVAGDVLDIGAHRGVVHHAPTELVLAARAGTPLSEIEDTLADHGQMLPFEPPAYGPGATLGGTIACNLSGPRRAYAGAARDFVLGTRVLDGKGDVLRFGGEVMKNVAGYDVSRLMTGAMGTLGALLEVSLKVLPRPETEVTLVRETTPADAIERMHDWARLPLPLSATAHVDGRLYARLSGSERGIAAAQARVGGEVVADGADFWRGVREHTLPFFAGPSLWRLSLRSDAPPLDLGGEWLVEWGGGLRWLKGDAEPEAVRGAARALGGHATWYRGHDGDDVFTPLSDGLMGLHRGLKAAFDPKGVMNPGRMYAGL